MKQWTLTDIESVSVSDADREIPTQGYTDNGGNEVHRVSGIIRLLDGWDFSVCTGNRCLIIFLTYDTKIDLLLVISFIFDILRCITTFSDLLAVFFAEVQK